MRSQIPRNGITDITQLIYGMEEMFGFGPDMALVLIGLALKTSVDLTTSVLLLALLLTLGL